MDSKDHCGIVQVSPEDFEVSKVSEALLPHTLWNTFGRTLLEAMPDKYREEIGRKAIEGASYVSQLEAVNTSRAARGERPLTMTQFMAGDADDRAEALSRRAAGDDEIGRITGHARRLAEALHEKHYPEVTQWRPLDDACGIIDQIDNMTTGLVRRAAGDDVGRLREAAQDALAGWRYIRKHHGDLYGVGWDRVEQKLDAALTSTSTVAVEGDEVVERVAEALAVHEHPDEWKTAGELGRSHYRARARAAIDALTGKGGGK